MNNNIYLYIIIINMGSCTSTEDVVENKKNLDVITHEATFKLAQPLKIGGKANGDMIIQCEPNTLHLARSEYLILKKDNPNFWPIYNSLVRNNIYEFNFDHNNYVISVNEP